MFFEKDESNERGLSPNNNRSKKHLRFYINGAQEHSRDSRGSIDWSLCQKALVSPSLSNTTLLRPCRNDIIMRLQCSMYRVYRSETMIGNLETAAQSATARMWGGPQNHPWCIIVSPEERCLSKIIKYTLLRYTWTQFMAFSAPLHQAFDSDRHDVVSCTSCRLSHSLSG